MQLSYQISLLKFLLSNDTKIFCYFYFIFWGYIISLLITMQISHSTLHFNHMKICSHIRWSYMSYLCVPLYVKLSRKLNINVCCIFFSSVPLLCSYKQSPELLYKMSKWELCTTWRPSTIWLKNRIPS